MAYDALRTIMPIGGWPKERVREVQISVSGTLGPRFAHDSPLGQAGFELPVPLATGSLEAQESRISGTR